jgi:hypothetical protein
MRAALFSSRQQQDTVLTDLTDGGVPAAGDLIYSVVGGQSRKVTVANLQTALGVGNVAEQISAGVTMSGTEVVFDNLDLTPYYAVEIVMDDVTVNTDDSYIFIMLSDDNGATWASADYDYSVYGRSAGAGADPHQNSAQGSGVPLVTDVGGSRVGNAANENFNARATLYNPTNTGWKGINFNAIYAGANGSIWETHGGGYRKITTEVDAIRIWALGTVTFTGGTARLIGYRHTPAPATLPSFQGGAILIEEVVFSGATTGTSGTLDLSPYHTVEAVIDLTVSTDNNKGVGIRVSDDNGSTYDSGGNQYDYISENIDSNGGAQEVRSSVAANAMFFPRVTGDGVGFAANEGLTARVHFIDPSGSTYKRWHFSRSTRIMATLPERCA